MSAPRRLAALPLLCVVLAGCGGASSVDAPSSTPTPAATRSASQSSGLEVGGTDLRLGGANTDDGKGERTLAGPSRPDPDELGRDKRHREGVGAGASCPDQDLMPAAENLDRVVTSTLCLLNGERADAGLGPLATNGKLASAAMEHTQDMVAKTYFAHDAPDGSSSTDRIRAAGYIPTDRAWTVGENLAWGTGTLATPKSIVAAWMNSPGHRENILRPVFNEIGFGVLVGNPSRADGLGATYTTTFGSLGGGSTPVSDDAPAQPASTPAAPKGSGKQAVKSTSSRKRTARSKSARKRQRARAARRARAAKVARARAARAKAAKRRG